MTLGFASRSRRAMSPAVSGALASDREQDRGGRGGQIVLIVPAQGAHEPSEAVPQMLGDLFGLSVRWVVMASSVPGS